MVDDSQNSASLQPTGATNGGTNNPQQIPQTGSLQPQANANLQPTTSLTPSQLTVLDQGSVSIRLNTVTATTTIPAQQPTPTTSSQTPVLVYGVVAIVCMAVFVYIVRGLVKHRA